MVGTTPGVLRSLGAHCSLLPRRPSRGPPGTCPGLAATQRPFSVRPAFSSARSSAGGWWNGFSCSRPPRITSGCVRRAFTSNWPSHRTIWYTQMATSPLSGAKLDVASYSASSSMAVSSECGLHARGSSAMRRLLASHMVMVPWRAHRTRMIARGRATPPATLQRQVVALRPMLGDRND